MEILEKGQLPGDKTYTTRCRRCETKFRFKRVEAKESHDPRDCTTVLQVTCPLHGCGEKIYVNA